MASGEEHDEVEDAASVGSVMHHLRAVHWKQETKYHNLNENKCAQ